MTTAAPAYAERPAGVGGAVLWRSVVPSQATTRVLPDGCLDVLWSGGALLVAGPDTAARLVDSPAGTTRTALRLPAGQGPALLGLPASAVVDRTVRLDELWPRARVAAWEERVAAGPAAGLLALLRSAPPADPLAAAVLHEAELGRSAAATADSLGLSVRQLHRRCLAAFGYGPQTLVRVLRAQRAVRAVRAGTSLAQVAADGGFADQPHLARELRALAGASPGRLRGGQQASRAEGRG